MAAAVGIVTAAVAGVAFRCAVMPALYITLGPIDTVGVLAVTAVLLSLYQLRASARRALVYDRRSPTAGRRDGTRVETAAA
jgi:hypothetical protein